jgi:molybdenum cofactor synthesis domain-containing protein
MVRTAILTVEEGAGLVGGQERTLQAVRTLLQRGSFVEVDSQTVQNQQAIVRSKLRLWADGLLVDMVITLGGEGLSLRDRTPDATSDVIEREVPGLTDLMRQARIAHDLKASLSRALAGIRNRTLILNLPSEATQAEIALGAVLDVLPSAIEIIVGDGNAAHGRSL